MRGTKYTYCIGDKSRIVISLNYYNTFKNNKTTKNPLGLFIILDGEKLGTSYVVTSICYKLEYFSIPK